MELFGPSGVRQFPTDRNPVTVALGSSGTSTGGVATTLAAYTVPAGRRADVIAQAGAIVTTALPAGATHNAQVFVTPSGGGPQAVYVASFAGAPAAGVRGDIPSCRVQLRAGDLVQITVFAAGVGVLQAGGGIHGVEYDA
jgi:hypothetical protein